MRMHYPRREDAMRAVPNRRVSGKHQADGRTRLLDTAERMLDELGIDGVSLRTLTTRAGHKNASAINYHFGTRAQLIEAVFARGHAPVEARRHTMLDALEASPPVTPKAALEAVILPLAELLHDEAGRRHLRLILQGVAHPDFYARDVTDFGPSLVRAVPHVLPLVAHLRPGLQMHRLRLGVGTVVFALGEQARLIDADPQPRKPVKYERFVADLIDSIVGFLKA
jgi:AcrR family transcriptional regulator